MGLTTISFQGKRIHLAESFAEVMSHIICEAVEQAGVTTYSEIIQNFYLNCDDVRKGNQSGWLNFKLDEYLPSETERTEMKSIFTDVMANLSSLGEFLSIEYLNQMEDNKSDEGYKAPWSFPIKISNMQTLMFLLRELVDGNCICENEELNFTGAPYSNPFGFNLE
jgi:hypothetical protein